MCNTCIYGKIEDPCLKVNGLSFEAKQFLKATKLSLLVDYRFFSSSSSTSFSSSPPPIILLLLLLLLLLRSS
jgi:hypothetical protein